MIEKSEEIVAKLNNYGDQIFTTNDCNFDKHISNYASFIKGKEVGSINYLDNNIDNSKPYIRVGNLETQQYDTFVYENEELKMCEEKDVLIALDGAPGRIGIGLNGYYSAGVYKVETKPDYLGLIYFYLRSKICQEIIKVNSQGTTILHAGKSLKEMKLSDEIFSNKEIFETIYKQLIQTKIKITKLKSVKENLLKKYFG